MSEIFTTAMGTLDQWMDFSGLAFGHSWVEWATWTSFWDSGEAPTYIVYGSILAFITMSFVASAYATVQTVNFAYLNLYLNGLGSNGIADIFGYYIYYAGASTNADRLGYWELAFIGVWELWALSIVLISLYAGAQMWETVDARLAEAKTDSKGIETPINMLLAIKTHTLLMVAGLSALISGYALGTIVNPVLTWIFFYQSRRTWLEGIDNGDNEYHVDGTSFDNDFLNHAITSIYGFIVLSAIATGGYYFAYQFIGIDDGFACDLQENVVSAATYAGIGPILAAQKDRASCYETIDQVFDIEDLDNDGTITRCEDATLQRAFGASADYALKFSSPFTRESFRKICNQNFSS